MSKQAPTMIDSIFEDSAQELSSVVVDHSAAAVDAYNQFHGGFNPYEQAKRQQLKR